MTLTDFLNKYLEFGWTVLAAIVVAIYTVVNYYKQSVATLVNDRIDVIASEIVDLRKLVYDTRETFVTIADLDNAVKVIISSNEKAETRLESLISEMQQAKADKAQCSIIHELAAVKQGRRASDAKKLPFVIEAE